jgi:hypothetical protein
MVGYISSTSETKKSLQFLAKVFKSDAVWLLLRSTLGGGGGGMCGGILNNKKMREMGFGEKA